MGVCVCVCVTQKERERTGERVGRKRERERKKGREREREEGVSIDSYPSCQKRHLVPCVINVCVCLQYNRGGTYTHRFRCYFTPSFYLVISKTLPVLITPTVFNLLLLLSTHALYLRTLPLCCERVAIP